MEEKRKSRLYNIDKIGAAFEDALKSNMKPLRAALFALKPKLLACLAEGYTIRDVIAMLQTAGIQGSERQLRYSLRQIGITDVERRDARRELREGIAQDVQEPAQDMQEPVMDGPDVQEPRPDKVQPAASAAE